MFVTHAVLELSYLTQLRFANNAAVEWGLSSGGDEAFRIIAADFTTNTASIGGLPVQVNDSGFDIVDGSLYSTIVTVNQQGNSDVAVDVAVQDANSAAVFNMATLTTHIAN